MRWSWLVAVALVVGCTGPVAGHPAAGTRPLATATPRHLATGGIVEYALPEPPKDCGLCSQAVGTMALGPDGNIWFIGGGPQSISRITPSGDISSYKMPVELAGGAQTIAAGPDGSMWVLGRGSDSKQPDWVLRVGVDGEVAKFPTLSIGPGTESITAGPDGNLWFTEFFASRIARITPSGVVTEFAIVNPNAYPRGITTGPDGNLWFAEDDLSRPTIGRISPQGVQTEFYLGQVHTDAPPDDIVVGPDGNLWVTRWTGEGLWRITPAGVSVAMPMPQGSKASKAITGPDGNVWFTDPGHNAIARMSPAGVTREFPLPRRNTLPYGMALGADGRIWFGEGNRIASIGVKVPEAKVSRQALIFADTSPKSITLTNTGDAALVIGGVKLSGADRAAFAVAADSCSGQSVNPGARCQISVSHIAAEPAGAVQSALLEVADNATGSPQKVSLVAQLRSCKLPIVESLPNMPAQGSMLDTTSGNALYEPRGGFTSTSSPARVVSVTEPVLTGQSAGYYDRPQGRWLPVPNGSSVSPDGSRYAYIPFDDPGATRVLDVVDVASAQDRVLPLSSGFWAIVAFTERGVYLHQAYEGIGPGLWLVDPDSGAMRQVLDGSVVDLVQGTTAWVSDFNRADTLPQWGMGGASNEIGTRDLVTGATRTWLYVPGSQLWVVATYNGVPVVSVAEPNRAEYFVVSSPNQQRALDLPFTNDDYPSLSGFVSDPQGLWLASPDGIYLWTQRTGGILVSTVSGVPAGTCA